MVLREFTSGRAVAVPRRDLQISLNRVSGAGVSRALAKLVSEQWLVVTDPATMFKSHDYSIGDRFLRDRGLLEEWFRMTSRIHDEGGLFALLGDFPLMARHGLNEANALVLGSLAAAIHTPSPNELDAFLAPLMARSTRCKATATLRSAQLVSQESLELVDDWRDRLAIHFRRTGAIEQALRIRWEVFCERDSWSPRSFESLLQAAEEGRGQRCVFGCGRASGTVTEFPPAPWGGAQSDGYFEAPVCEECASGWEQWLAALPVPTTNSAGDLVISDLGVIDRLAAVRLKVPLDTFLRERGSAAPVNAWSSDDTYGTWLALIAERGIGVVGDSMMLKAAMRRRSRSKRQT